MEAVLLESQLENLIFHFLRFDFFNSVWTWAAVFTAAISFWRIQTQTPPAPPAEFQYQPCQKEEENKAEKDIEPEAPTTSASCDLLSCICDNEVDGKTKRKFSVYLEEEEIFKGGDDWEFRSEEDNCSMVDEICVGNVGSWECFEFMLVKKNGDLGWYRHQDLTALDGRVVKLWEAERRGISLCNGKLIG